MAALTSIFAIMSSSFIRDETVVRLDTEENVRVRMLHRGYAPHKRQHFVSRVGGQGDWPIT
jgi:hypothetical protein